MSIFSIGKRLIDKHPRLLKVASLLYCFLSFNFFTGRKSNTIKRTGAFLQGCRITIKGKDNKVILGNCCYCKKLTINIMGNNNTIIVEDNVALNDVNICVEDSGGLVMIGSGTRIFGPAHLAEIEGTKIIIKEDCLFSSFTVLRTGDSHSIMDLHGNRINDSRDIVIGRHTWVGNKANILKGTKLCDDTIVAAGAIVTKSFDESNVIVAGIPAKIIKKDITWDKNRI